MYHWKLMIYVLPLLFSTFFYQNSLEAQIIDRSTNQSFPGTQIVQFNGSDHTLMATGVATRKKFFIKIYSIAHYMEDPPKVMGSAVFDEILNSKKPKRFYLKWVRNVSKKQIQDGYQESFNAVANRSTIKQIEADISKFVGFFNNGAKKGDSHILTWFPDGTIDATINGQAVGAIKNPDFARALWSIWIGPRSVVNRNDLISNIK